MQKIILEKKVNYYNKNDFINTETTEKRTLSNFDEALEIFKNTPINYVQNKKGISVYEELSLLHFNGDIIKRFIKNYDNNNKIIDNYKEDDNNG